jgi:hypothetical protein
MIEINIDCDPITEQHVKDQFRVFFPLQYIWNDCRVENIHDVGCQRKEDEDTQVAYGEG